MSVVSTLLLFTALNTPSELSVSADPRSVLERWAVIEDINGDHLIVETVSEEVWAEMVQLYQNGSERWIGGIVKTYENEWRFRFDPETILVAENTIEVWQTTIRGISGGLDYWLGRMAVVSARVVEVHQPLPVGGIWVAPNKLELLTPWIGLTAVIVLSLVATVVFVKPRKKKHQSQTSFR